MRVDTMRCWASSPTTGPTPSSCTKGVCSGTHRIAIQRMHRPADPTRVQARAHRRLRQHVEVAPRQRAGAAVELVGHRLRPLHRDVVRQEAVGAAHPGDGRALDGGVEVHHLHQAVHAGVGAAGAERGDRLRGELARGPPRACPARCGPRAGFASPRRPGRCSGCRGPASRQRSGGRHGRSAQLAEQLLGFGLDVAGAFGGDFLDQRAGAFDVAERLAARAPATA